MSGKKVFLTSHFPTSTFQLPNLQLHVANLNVITGLDLLSLTCIYDLAIDKSSVSAVQVRNHDPAVAAKRHRTVNARHARVVQPDGISGSPAYVRRGAL